jgi:hypothetical protein
MASQEPKAEQEEDEQHRKFREALERKNAQHHARAESAENTGKHEAHNDKHQRQFRRKAGS